MFDAKALIEYGGLLLVFLAIYGQTGILFCFFVPSGALMFEMGAMIASGELSYSLLTVFFLLTVAAIMGNLTGYYLGWKTGPLLYDQPDSWFFKKKHLTTAAHFYDKYGGRALSFGLFLPIVRTFAPVVAGMIRMKLGRFVFYIAVGSVSWVLSFLLMGYLIGSRPFFKPYLKYIVTGIVIIVSIPVVVKIVKEFRKKSRQI